MTTTKLTETRTALQMVKDHAQMLNTATPKLAALIMDIVQNDIHGARFSWWGRLVYRTQFHRLVHI